MKVLLIGNYENLRQQSMQRFVEMLRDGLNVNGHEVRVVRPPPLLGRLWRGEVGLAKWVGYLDRFLLYIPLLRRQLRWADVVHICVDPIYVPRVSSVPHVFTCHDVLPIRVSLGEIPEVHAKWSGRIYQAWSLRSLKKAQIVACVSEETKREARRLTALPESRLVVVANALNYPYQPMHDAELAPHLHVLGMDANQPFFLHVGGNMWYKNRPGVIRLFAELAKQPTYRRHRLVLAGKPWTNEMRRLAASLKLEGRVEVRADISDEQLRALYSRAEALLFPSIQEGFGWPIVEAQACGCPVATTNHPPMNEVGGSAAIYINPVDLAGAASTIAMALSERERWRVAGLKNAAKFSTQAMVDGYVQCYRRAMELSTCSVSAENFVVGERNE